MDVNLRTADPLPDKLDAFDEFYLAEWNAETLIAPLAESHVTDQHDGPTDLTIYSDIGIFEVVPGNIVNTSWNVTPAKKDNRGRSYGYNVHTVEEVTRADVIELYEDQ